MERKNEAIDTHPLENRRESFESLSRNPANYRNENNHFELSSNVTTPAIQLSINRGAPEAVAGEIFAIRSREITLHFLSRPRRGDRFAGGEFRRRNFIGRQ